jgi:hypothetical protein
LLEEFRDQALCVAIERHDSAALFDRLMYSFSFQGISDQIAINYMQRHGQATWRSVRKNLARRPTCPKLKTYWAFDACRYEKTSRTCAEPDHIAACPLPTHQLRNGHLNQIAYSLYLFVRDVADGDLVGWIDDRLDQVNDLAGPDSLAAARTALIEPLRNVYGISDKVLGMALSGILIGAADVRPKWAEVGVQLIAVDTLVHNFLHRTGILSRFEADHPYGPGCYRSFSLFCGKGGVIAYVMVLFGQVSFRKSPCGPSFCINFADQGGVQPKFTHLPIHRGSNRRRFDIPPAFALAHNEAKSER